jgi:3-deoxy-D-manno-octulosonic-acid transferase
VKPPAAIKTAIWLYDRVWLPLIPFLRRHRRLTNGFEQRLGNSLPRPADVWIQAASAGEAFLALELARTIQVRDRVSILLSSHTKQGVEILSKHLPDGDCPAKQPSPEISYFPLDRPRIMSGVVRAVGPSVMVLLETEIWPGHLLALKQSGCRILLLNGRLTPRSLTRYRLWPGLWRKLGPDEVLAVSPDDANRFKNLFPDSAISTMPNMKFDRMVPPDTTESRTPLAGLKTDAAPLIVLGSIRQAEEAQTASMISALLARIPGVVIGLFPRHPERLGAWQMMLGKAGFRWRLRSELKDAVEAGSIILWDRFGELAWAYGSAQAAFVGGSLKPLGGQNFLEPLQSGIVPVIGPHWRNFHWVGPEVVAEGLLKVAANWQQAVDLLAQTVAEKRSRAGVRAAARDYIEARRGGTRRASELVLEYLKSADRTEFRN